jgi:hypothetical protein
MSLRRYEEQSRAFEELDAIEHGALFAAMAEPVGERSALAEGAIAEQGPAIAFVEGRTVVMLQSPSASDGTTLLDVEQITDLAQRVAGRL